MDAQVLGCLLHSLDPAAESRPIIGLLGGEHGHGMPHLLPLTEVLSLHLVKKRMLRIDRPQLLDQGVDVILPVGGPIYQGALTAIADSGDDVALIGVDADFYETDPSTQDVVMTSILKNMKVSTYEAVMAAGNDEFDPEAYVGTLENDGVGIAPFHDYEGQVSESLQGELDEVKAGIIDGSIEVKSYLNP